jgi:DNA-binding NarL/FixJ family response regulator
MPRLLREIVVTSLSHQDGLEVVEAAEAGADLSRLLDQTGCQVLMLSRDGAELAPAEQQLLRARPRLRVLVLDGEGRQAALFESVSETGPRKRCLQEVSMEGLVAAIRASVARLEREELSEPSSH